VLEFPLTSLAKLDDMINRPRWVVPVLPEGELEVLLKAAIALSKKGVKPYSLNSPCSLPARLSPTGRDRVCSGFGSSCRRLDYSGRLLENSFESPCSYNRNALTGESLNSPTGKPQ